MLSARDLVLLAVNLVSILAGAFFPRFGAIFQPYLLYCMMTLLFLSFLTIRVSAVWETTKNATRSIIFLVLVKMILLPSGVFILFRTFMPEYALSALLLSGISTGVVSPLYAQMVQANSPLVLVMVVVTSFLAPFTLPALIHFLLGRSVEISLTSMVELLSFAIFIPICTVELLKRIAPLFIDALIKRRFRISLVFFAVTNLAAFSKYSDFFHRNPSIIFFALAIAIILATIFFLSGLLFSWGKPIEDQLAMVISLGLMNNILAIVFSSEFFGPMEPTIAAIYGIPFVGLIIPLRIYQGFRMGHKVHS